MKKTFSLTEVMSFYYGALVNPRHQTVNDLKDIFSFFGTNAENGDEENVIKWKKTREYLKTKLPWLPTLDGWPIISDNSDRPQWLRSQENLYGSEFELENDF